jgi:hypothetical protein
MATLQQPILGKISGSVGGITFRKKNGVNYVSARPSSFLASNDDASINRRSRFAFSCKLSAAMISLAPIKSLWNAETADGHSAYNLIVGTNYRFVSVDSVLEQAFLTPGLGFGIKTTSINIASSGVQVVTEAIGTNAGVVQASEATVQLATILSFSAPVDETVDGFFLIPLLSSPQTLALDAALTFSIPLTNQEQQLYAKYNTRKALFALVTLDADGNPVHYSGTFAE